MYHSKQHWKRLANGFSGWSPKDYGELVGRMRGSRRLLEADAPVRFVVIHDAQHPPEQARRPHEAMEQYRDRLPLRARFADDAVYEMTPRTDGPASQ